MFDKIMNALYIFTAIFCLIMVGWVLGDGCDDIVTAQKFIRE